MFIITNIFSHFDQKHLITFKTNTLGDTFSKMFNKLTFNNLSQLLVLTFFFFKKIIIAKAR